MKELQGSRFLQARVRRLRPRLHVFGHTHFGWDAELNGQRYLQAALGYPRERRELAKLNGLMQEQDAPIEVWFE